MKSGNIYKNNFLFLFSNITFFDITHLKILFDEQKIEYLVHLFPKELNFLCFSKRHSKTTTSD